MAEALAIVGGLAAVTQLAGMAWRLGQDLSRLAANVWTTSDEIKIFADQLKTSSTVIRLSQCTIVNFCEDSPESGVVKHIKSRQLLEKIDTTARRVLRHLRQAYHKVRGMRKSSSLVITLTWFWRKASILEFYPAVECVKTNLGLLISSVLMEEVRSKLVRGLPVKNEQIDLLQQVISDQLRTIEDLRSQVRRLSRRTRATESLFIALSEQDPFLDLGRSMYKA
ncbi:hypothetical protein VTK26DRAFT_3800 [Humicola hyalothermophila]